MEASSINRVTVIGPGRIGHGIAQAFALAGLTVELRDVKERPPGKLWSTLEAARSNIEANLSLMVEEGLLNPSGANEVLGRVIPVSGFDPSIYESQFIVEAVPERLEVKREVIARASTLCREDAIIASASSTIYPSLIADAVRRPANLIGTHWLNPAFIIPLVEVVKGKETSGETVQVTVHLLRRVGKTPVICSESPGFIGARLQALLMNEAVRIYEEGVASPYEIDKAVMAGIGFRYATIGVFEFIDWGGVDILYYADEYLSKGLDDPKFLAPRTVVEKMERGEKGVREGRGYYDYTGSAEVFDREKKRQLLRRLKQMGYGPPSMAGPPLGNR